MAEGIPTVVIFALQKRGKQAMCGGCKENEMKSMTCYGSPIQAVCTAEGTCFIIDKFTREFHFDTLYLYKIIRHVDFKSITTPTKLLSKPPSEGFNSPSPFRSFHHAYFNALQKTKSLSSDNGTVVATRATS
jgi:hypothetical protein